MSTVTFTITDNITTSLTITGSIVYGTQFWKKRLNQFKLDISDGTEKVYDSGPTKIYGELVMKNLASYDGEDFREWLEDYVKFQKNRFTISAVTGVDLGNGTNTALLNVRYAGGTDSEGMVTLVPPQKYDLFFPYMLLVS